MRVRATISAVLTLLATVTLLPLSAGTITGTVSARSATEDPDAGDAGGAYGSRRYKFLEKVDYDAMRDFVVAIERVSLPPPADQPAPKATIVQRDGAFVPHVLPVVVGTVVEWPNADDIFHNVFSVSDICSFDLGLYKRGGETKRVTFNATGRIDVFCSIHTKMSCIVLVLPNPWFARTDDKGHYTIKNVPAGTYKLRAWHERLPAQSKEIVVSESGDVQVDFTLGFAGAPKS